MTLTLALVAGPMYDGLYSLLAEEDVEVVVRADHPTLNREVAKRLASAERIDVLSTHSKYAPSQQEWLRPLDDLVAPEVLSALAPKAVDLCRFNGTLLCAPRNIDVRTLWYRTDRLAEPPDSWADLEAGVAVFGFPGRESGLFGTFFELVTSAGGALFTSDGQPAMVSDAGIAAVERLVRLARRAPADLPQWHYDEVDDALLGGRIDLAALWPGGFGPLRESSHADLFDVAPYMAGSVRRASYAGCHGWAIPTTAGDVSGAIALIERLCSAEAARLDASGGSVCAHVGAFAAVQPRDAVDERRLAITRATIADAMITYPPLTRFPEIEDAGWIAINAALRGQQSPATALRALQQAAEEALA